MSPRDRGPRFRGRREGGAGSGNAGPRRPDEALPGPRRRPAVPGAPEAPERTGFSLPDVHGTIHVPPRGPIWRSWLAVTGPALMVSVGYMDPGNFATDIAGGSLYEYRLLWVLLLSNLMALLLQSLAARLGIVRRRDLAQASREEFPRAVNLALYGLAEIAIIATDLAEVIGSAIALHLLFRIPLLAGVLLSLLDVVLLLFLLRFGIRKLEAVILSLVGTMGVAFLLEILLAQPHWGALAHGFIPSIPDRGALYVAIGILGATVMPHNLYLHSALVQTRSFPQGTAETRRSIRLNVFDSAVALNLAFLINASILVMAAAVFYRTGHRGAIEIGEAHQMLEPILGAAVAPLAFAVALLASGQSATVTGTLAGQIVMEGYLDFRIRPWLRRLITRAAAVIPAALTLVLLGPDSTGGLLVLTQVVLSLQLPFAAIPLIHFVSDRSRMGEHAIGPRTRVAAWIAASVIVGLNLALVAREIGPLAHSAGRWGGILRAVLLIASAAFAVLLVRVTFHPIWGRLRARRAAPQTADVHRESERQILLEPPAAVRRAAIALDFSGREEKLLNEAVRFLGTSRPVLALLHVSESPSARAFGREALDVETRRDTERLEGFARALRGLGYEVETRLGAGDPIRELARMVTEFEAELVILGGHGHRGLLDVIHGTTAEALRHRVHASVLVIPLARE